MSRANRLAASMRQQLRPSTTIGFSARLLIAADTHGGGDGCNRTCQAANCSGVSAIIEKWSPDVVALQEVDSRGRTDDPFAKLADVVGEHRADARSIVTQDGD